MTAIAPPAKAPGAAPAPASAGAAPAGASAGTAGRTCPPRAVPRCEPRAASFQNLVRVAWSGPPWAMGDPFLPFAPSRPGNDGLDMPLPPNGCVALGQAMLAAMQDAAQAGTSGGMAGLCAVPANPAIREGFDCAMLARMLAREAPADTGIFEVEMPGGERMGVVVQARGAGLGFLLSPATERTQAQLRRVRVELEGQVGRRIGRGVTIAVL